MFRNDWGWELIKQLENRLHALQESLEAKKAMDVVLLDLRPLSVEVDAFLICHATSLRHVKALCEATKEKLQEIGDNIFFSEGLEEGNWVLMDCGDFLVHIFNEKSRDFYRLEDLWAHAPIIKPMVSSV